MRSPTGSLRPGRTSACQSAVLATDPLRVSRACRDLAVERHRGLEQHPRPPDACMLAEGLIEQPRLGGELAAGDDHLHALVAQNPEPAPRRLLGGIVRSDHHPLEPGLNDRVGARRCLSLVTARLQRDIQRRPAQILQTTGLDRVDLGVGATELLVPALTEDLAVAGHHRAHDRIRADRARAVARELNRPLQVCSVGVRADRHLLPRITPLSARTGHRAGGRC